MKQLPIAFFFLLLCLADSLRAQHVKMITSGSIEYEKSVNVAEVMSKLVDDKAQKEKLLELYKTKPKFAVFKSSLDFSQNKTLYNSGAEAASYSLLNPAVAQNNLVYTDLETGVRTTQRDSPYGLFLVTDTVRPVKWKVTDETRTILGYPCRRANGLIMDSVYVVAFFTGDIPVSGGPESFTGLPGMILLLSLPHENMTWTATKIDAAAPPALAPPTKGKKKTQAEYRAIVETQLKIPQGTRRKIYLRGLLL
ncbi:GLPGLI family protein [Hufsiella ginkgonis]|uniref:GLPGLI family protein n=1 Tax=Hufsiella ginkgonis TaxID=2695274 RepID=A0A7K1XU94_9SPHI|nr:GLPGLI family protein [Hufsiella ginkgonis]MXV14066.1 GLPGLI family protein [Hufsiella ginkgonis]